MRGCVGGVVTLLYTLTAIGVVLWAYVSLSFNAAVITATALTLIGCVVGFLAGRWDRT